MSVQLLRGGGAVLVRVQVVRERETRGVRERENEKKQGSESGEECDWNA